jgi:hypothetical protein
MSEGAVSIQDIINMNTNSEGISKIEPVVTNSSNYILISSKHYGQPEKIVIVFTGSTQADNAVKSIKEYYLVKQIDDYIQIYSKDTSLDEDIVCQLLGKVGYKIESCGIMGGKRKRRITKKNKKRKSKKCKSKRRRRK